MRSDIFVHRIVLQFHIYRLSFRSVWTFYRSISDRANRYSTHQQQQRNKYIQFAHSHTCENQQDDWRASNVVEATGNSLTAANSERDFFSFNSTKRNWNATEPREEQPKNKRKRYAQTANKVEKLPPNPKVVATAAAATAAAKSREQKTRKYAEQQIYKYFCKNWPRPLSKRATQQCTEEDTK